MVLDLFERRFPMVHVLVFGFLVIAFITYFVYKFIFPDGHNARLSEDEYRLVKERMDRVMRGTFIPHKPGLTGASSLESGGEYGSWRSNDAVPPNDNYVRQASPKSVTDELLDQIEQQREDEYARRQQEEQERWQCEEDERRRQREEDDRRYWEQQEEDKRSYYEDQERRRQEEYYSQRDSY
jgi:hypothetical protein